MKYFYRIATLLLVVTSSAFAGMDDLNIKSDITGDYVLGVAAHDQREIVLKEGYSEAQVGGYIKGFLRTRAKTLTNTEGPAADELAEGLRLFFIRQKFLGVAALATAAKNSPNEVVSRIKKAGLKRTVLVRIDDLWTESYKNTSVNYKFTIVILDQAGQQIAASTAEGIHDTREWGDDAAGEIFSKIMAETLRKPEFVDALKG